MYKLFIDTHFLDLIIVLYKDELVVDKFTLINIKNQSEHLLLSINNMFQQNRLKYTDIAEIIIVNGPGSFTGVRLGVSVAKTMAYLGNIKIKCISSLQVLASQIDKPKFIVSVKENNGYYIGIFNNDFINPEYKYLKNSEMDTYVTNNIIEEVNFIDYEKLIKKCADLKITNPHLVNPLYIKVIEVQNGKKSKTE